MADVFLPIQPFTLTSPYCFTSWQQTLNDFAANMKAVLSGQAFYNIGPTKPDPSLNGYPWLNTSDGRWYVFAGTWITPNPEIPGTGIRRLFRGTLADLITYDGGSAGAVGPSTGPMWVEDTVVTAGRSPMHPGLIPNSNPATTLAVPDPTGATGSAGEGAHLNLQEEVAPHTHPLTADGDITNADGTIKFVTTGVGGPGIFKGLTGPAVAPLATQAPRYTTTQKAANVVHPVVSMYLIMRSARLNYSI